MLNFQEIYSLKMEFVIRVHFYLECVNGFSCLVTCLLEWAHLIDSSCDLLTIHTIILQSLITKCPLLNKLSEIRASHLKMSALHLFVLQLGCQLDTLILIINYLFLKNFKELDKQILVTLFPLYTKGRSPFLFFQIIYTYH